MEGNWSRLTLAEADDLEQALVHVDDLSGSFDMRPAGHGYHVRPSPAADLPFTARMGSSADATRMTTIFRSSSEAYAVETEGTVQLLAWPLA